MRCFAYSAVMFIALATRVVGANVCRDGVESNFEFPQGYISQKSQCDAFIAQLPASAQVSHPGISEVNTVISKATTIASAFNGNSVNWQELILQGWSGSTATILVAPVVLVLVLAFTILSIIPCCIGRCCCPAKCCIPKHEFRNFPKKGCGGTCISTTIWLLLVLGLLASIGISWYGVLVSFNGITQTSCQSMTVLGSAYEFLNDIFAQFIGVLETFNLNTLILAPATGLLQQINASSESIILIANVTIEDARIACENISSSNYTFDCDSLIPSISSAFIDTSSLNAVLDQIVSILGGINGTLNQARSGIVSAQSAVSEPFDLVASSAFAFNFKDSPASSVIPAIPPVPIFLPNGQGNGSSVNHLLLNATSNQGTVLLVGVAAWLLHLLFILCIILGTCCMCCGNSDKQSPDDKDLADKDSSKTACGFPNCAVCCGVCLNRFGCGALYFCNIIGIVLAIVFVFVNIFYDYSCGIISLPPNQAVDVLLQNDQISSLLNIDNSTQAIVSTFSTALGEGTEANIAPLLQSFGINASSLEINVTQYEEDLSGQFNLTAITDAIDSGRSSLSVYAANFSSMQASQSEVEIRQNACELPCSNTSGGVNVWEAARRSYNQSVLFEPFMDAINSCADNHALICGAIAGPPKELWENCNLTFCEAASVTIKLNSLVGDALQGLDQIDSNLATIRSNVTSIPLLISDIFDTIGKQNISDCLSLDISPVTGFVSQITEPICTQIYSGFSMISWSSFAMGVLSALLFIVQVIMNIRLGAVGQPGIEKVSQGLSDGGDGNDGDMHDLGDQANVDRIYNAEVHNPLYANPIQPNGSMKQAWAENDGAVKNSSTDIEMTNVSAFKESEIEV